MPAPRASSAGAGSAQNRAGGVTRRLWPSGDRNSAVQKLGQSRFGLAGGRTEGLEGERERRQEKGREAEEPQQNRRRGAEPQKRSNSSKADQGMNR